MNIQRLKSLRFLLTYFLPVAGVALLAVLVNLVSFAELRSSYLQASARQEVSTQRVEAIARFNQDMAQLQIEVGDMLEKAATAQADEAQMYLFHSEVVNRLASLQSAIDGFAEEIPYQSLLIGARRDFQNYQDFLIRATDVAAVEPTTALRHAFAASQAQVKVAEHTQAIATIMAAGVAEQNREYTQTFEEQALRTGITGAVLMVVLLLLWLFVAERVTRRLARLAEALGAIARNDVNPPALPFVAELSQHKGSLMRDMARAVLTFRDSVITNKETQYALAERMKELSCLYDVMALTEDLGRDLDDMLDGVRQRLPEAMRFPAMAAGWIEYQGRRYGEAPPGPALHVVFGGSAQQPDVLGVGYTAPLPPEAGEPFLPEEQALMEALQTRLRYVLNRRQVEAQLAMADRALRTARQCGQLLIHARNEDELMQDICRLAVEVGGYRMAWVGIAEQDEEGSVRPVASAGFDDNYLQTAQISWKDGPRGRGTTGTAIRERRTVVTKDLLTNPNLAPWREAAVQRGYAAALALPIFVDGDQCLGALCLHAKEVDAFNPDEVELLNQMASDLSFGIRTLRARQALNENLATLRKLYLAVEQSPESIVITDLEARIEYVNQAFERNTGYSRQEAMGLNPRVLKSGLTPVETYDAMWAALVQGQPWSGELYNQRKDGSHYAEMANIAPVRQADGTITHYVAIKEDITEKKRMAQELAHHREHLEELVVERTEALARKEDELRLLLESTSEGIFGLDTQGLITFVNPTALRMLGYDHAQALTGLPAHATLLPRHADGSDYPAHEGTMHRAMQSNQVQHSEAEVFWRKDGSVFDVAYAAAPLVRNAAVVGVVIAFQDITERKRVEAALLEAKAAAEAATRSKSEFLANMSHEIRTPMNAIIGMSHLALHTQLDKRQRNYIEKVRQAGENLLGIINDILDFSKIEAGKMRMEQIEFDLDQVLDNLASVVGIKTEDKGLELVFDAADNLPTALVGDPLRLGQVLINLCNNAAKFTHAGDVTVGIEKVADHDDGVELHFWVRDTGIGMSAQQCGKLFESFSQADASTTRKYGGTGLGLAISKNLVEQMGGRIWVDSVEGKGSTFHFHARFGVQANPQPRRMPRADELQGLRVLIVDDNASAREILGSMAKTFGLEVELAISGGQALRMVAKADAAGLPYDMVLLDWKMPEMDGVETVRRLRAENLSRVPTVIMVTAYSRDDALATAQQQGVPLQTVLVKPVTPSVLLEAIGEVLGNSARTVVHADAASGNEAALASLRGARLLLVEDNDLNLELALELLAEAGVEVVTAANGQEALDRLAQDADFDGVLMDCQMPVMDGYTATREIRKNPLFKGLPIIAMTANAMAGDREKVLEAGMWDHIAKPINVGQMYTTLARWIHPHPERAMPVGGADPLAVTPSLSTATAATPATASVAAAAAAADAQHPPWLATLEAAGVDTRFGLAAALSKETLYRRLLRKFRDSQGAFAAMFAAARSSTDASAARRCVHTLRGTAATLGAKALQRAADALEDACKQRASDAQLAPLLADVLEALSPVMAALQSLGPVLDDTVAATAPALDAQKVAAFRQRLLELLDLGDSSVIEYCDTHADLLSAAYPAQWQRISDHVRGFDFEAAQNLIQSL